MDLAYNTVLFAYYYCLVIEFKRGSSDGKNYVILILKFSFNSELLLIIRLEIIEYLPVLKYKKILGNSSSAIII